MTETQTCVKKRDMINNYKQHHMKILFLIEGKSDALACEFYV